MQASSRIHCSLVIDKRKEKADQVQRCITQVGMMNGSLQHQKGQKLPRSPSPTKQHLDGIKLRSQNTPRRNAKDERELFELKDNTDKRINSYKLTPNKRGLEVRGKPPTKEETFTTASQQKWAA